MSSLVDLSSTRMSEQIVTISPSTNKPIVTRAGLSAAEIALLPRKAERAFEDYRLTSLKERQACSIERVYVDEKIHDTFVAAMQEVLKGYKLGDPLDPTTNIGPVVSKKAVQTIQAHVKDALEKGAQDVTPPNRNFSSPPPDGNYVRPTLLTGVTHDMDVMNEETFGPIIPVMKVGNDEEAVRLMNDSEFGLTASIWTKDTSRGEELAESVEAGTVFVNRCDFPSPVSLAAPEQ